MCQEYGALTFPEDKARSGSNEQLPYAALNGCMSEIDCPGGNLRAKGAPEWKFSFSS
jgi:hypothetical protein